VIQSRGLKASYVLLVMKDAFPQDPITIADVAKLVVLTPEVTFRNILWLPQNLPVVKYLYRTLVLPHLGPKAKDADHADPTFMRVQVQATGMPPHAPGKPQEHLYPSWQLPLSQVEKILLPLQQGFKDVMKKAAEEQARQLRLLKLHEDEGQLETWLEQIEHKTEKLTGRMQRIRELSAQGMRDVSTLLALEGLLQAIYYYPKEEKWDRDNTFGIPGTPRGPLPQWKDDLDALAEHGRRMRRLIEKCMEVMVEHPPGTEDDFKERDQAANDLKNLVEATATPQELQQDPKANRKFIDLIEVLVANRDVLENDRVWNRTMDALTSAFQVLLVSPVADATFQDHILPAIEVMASKGVDLSKLKFPNLGKEFEKAVHDNPNRKPSRKPLEILAGILGEATTHVGNMPGPETTLVAIFQTALPILMCKLVGGMRQDARTWGGKLFRWYTIFIGLVDAKNAPVKGAEKELEALWKGCDHLDLKLFHDEKGRPFNFAKNFQAHKGWATGCAMANFIVLYACVTNDDQSTMQKILGVISSGIPGVIETGKALERFRVIEAARIEIAARMGITIAKRALTVFAVLGTVATIGLAIIDLQSAWEVNDTWTIGVDIVKIGVGVVEIGGCLAAAEMLAVLGLTPIIGEWIMGAALVVYIIIEVADWAHTKLTNDAQIVFEDAMKFFTRSGGAYDHAPKTELEPLLKAVKDHKTWRFWYGSTFTAGPLLDVGFDDERTGKIIGEPASRVQRSSLYLEDVSGTIRAAATGDKVLGATVTAARKDKLQPDVTQLSDANGFYSVALFPGAYAITFTKGAQSTVKEIVAGNVKFTALDVSL
jgi:hypothetical protein